MKERCLVLFAVLGLFLSGCATQPAVPANTSRPELKRVTQLDVTTNLPVKSWNARTDTIHQHVTPPVGIRFVDADTGKEIHFEGTYKIESYRPSPSMPNESALHPAKPEPSPVETH
jgi:hypothetical protein